MHVIKLIPLILIMQVGDIFINNIGFIKIVSVTEKKNKYFNFKNYVKPKRRRKKHSEKKKVS